MNLKSTTPSQFQFRAYCDTFSDFQSEDDEKTLLCQSFWICLPDQWQCRSGHSISSSSILNEVFDCPDASDEQNMFASDLHPLNYKYSWFNISDLVNKFDDVYWLTDRWSVCHFTEKSPCSPSKSSNVLFVKKYCINSTTLRHENVSCPSKCDERSIIDHCYLSLRTLGKEVQCLSMRMCLTFSHRFQYNCTNSSNQPLPCQMTDNDGNILPPGDFQCWDGERIRERCDTTSRCTNEENKYMCGAQYSFTSSPAQKYKFDFQTTQKQLHLLHFSIECEYY